MGGTKIRIKIQADNHRYQWFLIIWIWMPSCWHVIGTSTWYQYVTVPTVRTDYMVRPKNSGTTPSYRYPVRGTVPTHVSISETNAHFSQHYPLKSQLQELCNCHQLHRQRRQWRTRLRALVDRYYRISVYKDFSCFACSNNIKLRIIFATNRARIARGSLVIIKKPYDLSTG
jgi:hypothetical protein